MVSLGEAGELSPNASAMLRISTLSAWAQLQVSSMQQGYLENVVKPYQATLSSLWVAALRDYASIRIDSEFLHDTSSVVDSSYSSLGKEVLLPVSLLVACDHGVNFGLSTTQKLGQSSFKPSLLLCKQTILIFLWQWMGKNTAKLARIWF